MGKVKAKGQPAPRKTSGKVPFGAFRHPAGALMEIASGPDEDVVIIRIAGRLDFVFKAGEPFACGTVAGKEPSFLYQQAAPAAPPEPRKPASVLVLPGRPRVQ